jgi:ribosomal protein S18 acetylase RimI-like enzyme
MHPGTQYNYRKAVPADSKQLRELGLVSYGQFQHVLTEDNWQKMELNLKREGLFEDLLGIASGFVCEHNDEIIGMAFLVPSNNPTKIFSADWSYIRMVGVDPQYTGNGIAKALTKMCMERAEESNEKTIALHTSEFMDAARHIYTNLGFKILKEIEPLFGKKYWVYTYDITENKKKRSGTDQETEQETMLDIKLTHDENYLDECAKLMHESEPFVTLNFELDRCKVAVRGDYKETYLALYDGEFAGFVVLQLTGVLRGYIQTICLKPEFRNKGIGTALLKFSEERLLKISPNVFMCVSSFNYDAQKLYRRLGFEQVGVLTNHIVTGYDEYLLRKTTGPFSEFKPQQQ